MLSLTQRIKINLLITISLSYLFPRHALQARHITKTKQIISTAKFAGFDKSKSSYSGSSGVCCSSTFSMNPWLQFGQVYSCTQTNTFSTRHVVQWCTQNNVPRSRILFQHHNCDRNNGLPRRSRGILTHCPSQLGSVFRPAQKLPAIGKPIMSQVTTHWCAGTGRSLQYRPRYDLCFKIELPT